MTPTELTDRLIDDLENINKAMTIIPNPQNIVGKVSAAALKGGAHPFYLEEFTASLAIYVSIPAAINRLRSSLNIGNAIVDATGDVWQLLQQIKANRNAVEEKMNHINQEKKLVFITMSGAQTPVSNILLESLNEISNEASTIANCVKKITG